MRARITPALLAVCAANVLIALGAMAAEPVEVVVLEPGSGALDTLVRREVASAAELGKVPFVQITAEWCGPCKKLRASLDDPAMRAAFAGTYIIRVDFDAWEKQLKAEGFVNEGIPVFFAVDKEGHPTGEKIDGGAWGEDIPANMAPPLQKFFAPIVARAR